jgi:hypothetical protein
MNAALSLRLGAVALLLCLVSAAGAQAPVPAGAPGSSIQGVWKNTDTTIRVVVNKNEARGVFVEIGQGAKAIGFKPGELSFVATVDGNNMHGEQTIRYSGNCHQNGRKVPFIARMTPDGRSLAMHNYFITIDANCRDTGGYDLIETLWQRQAAR